MRAEYIETDNEATAMLLTSTPFAQLTAKYQRYSVMLQEIGSVQVEYVGAKRVVARCSATWACSMRGMKCIERVRKVVVVLAIVTCWGSWPRRRAAHCRPPVRGRTTTRRSRPARYERSPVGGSRRLRAQSSSKGFDLYAHLIVVWARRVRKYTPVSAPAHTLAHTSSHASARTSAPNPRPSPRPSTPWS